MSERHPYDFYATPPEVTKALLRNHTLRHGPLLEPCAGDGAILRVIRECYPHDWFGIIHAQEIREEEEDSLKEVADAVMIGDFLDTSGPHYGRGDNGGEFYTIITNPPFSIAEDILERCFEVHQPDTTEVIMLLRLGFLESKKRWGFWKQHPLSALYVLSQRPSFTGKGTDSTAYGWFVWNSEKTGIYVI